MARYDVTDGETSTGLTLNNDSMYVSAGGTATNTTVNNGGQVDVDNGGVMNDTTVGPGGSLHISSGGKLTGKMTFADGAVVSADEGAVIDFDVSELAPGNAAPLNNLSLVSGWGTAYFTATISNTQATGTYTFAENAAGFDRTITVQNMSSESFDSLSVGETTRIVNRAFSLDMNDGTLSLTVTEVPREESSLVVTTTSNVVDAYDGLISLTEAITYAKSLGGVQTVSFNMPDEDTVTISDPDLIYRDLRFASINMATENSVTITLDDLNVSGRTCSSENSSTAGGAVVHLENVNLEVSGGDYSNNRDNGSLGWGGALRTRDSIMTIEDAVFQNNYSYSSGGAVNTERTQLTIRNTHFEGNSVCGFGGALVLFTNENTLLVDTDFVNNSTGYSTSYRWAGGAIWLERSYMVYEVTEGKTITNTGNDSSYGGFIALTVKDGVSPSTSTAVFRVNGTLNIGNGDGKDGFSSEFTKNGNFNVYVYKTGTGTMTINAPISDYDGEWIVEDGVLAFTYASGGDFDGDITISGGQMCLGGEYAFKKLTFQLGEQANSQPFIDNVANLSGGTFSIDVSSAEEGVYLLAGCAEEFDQTITVTDSLGAEIGKLAVGDKALSVDDMKYKLELNDSELTLTAYRIISDGESRNNWLYNKTTKKWNSDANIAMFYKNEVTAGDSMIYLDRKGTVEPEDGKNNFLGRVGTREDPADYAKIELARGAALHFSIDSTIAGTFYVYEKTLNKKGNPVTTLRQKIVVKADRFSPAKLTPVFLEAGEYFVGMETTLPDEEIGNVTGYYNVNLTGTSFFDEADNGWNNSAYQLDGTGKEIKTELNSELKSSVFAFERGVTDIKLDTGATSMDGYDNWGGFSDATDYRMITLENDASLTLSLTATDKAKITIWKVTTNGKTGKISLSEKSSATAKANKTGTIKAKIIKSGTYFISVTSTNASKGGDAYYNLKVDGKTVFFDSSDDGENNVLYVKKTKTFVDDSHFVSTELVAGSQDIQLDSNTMGNADYENFVGYQDAADYAKIVLTTAGNLRFTIAATGDATFVVYKKGQDKKNNDTLVALQTTKLKLGKGDDVIDKYTDVLSDLAPGEYFISMTAKNTKANEKGSVFYNVTATLAPSAADALAMPESDKWGVSDALSFASPDALALPDAAAVSFAELNDASGWQSLLA